MFKNLLIAKVSANKIKKNEITHVDFSSKENCCGFSKKGYNKPTLIKSLMVLVIKNTKPVRVGTLECTQNNIKSDKTEESTKKPYISLSVKRQLSKVFRIVFVNKKE